MTKIANTLIKIIWIAAASWICLATSYQAGILRATAAMEAEAVKWGHGDYRGRDGTFEWFEGTYGRDFDIR